MRVSRRTPFWTGLITAIVLLVVVNAIFISGIPAGPQISLPWDHTMTVKVQLSDADALAPHASVEIAGVKIGEVQSVAAQNSLAVATLQIAGQYANDIHSDSTVYLRAHGLFGPKYIAIVPGNGAVLGDASTITVNQTVEPVDLNAILQDLQQPEQQSLHTFFVQFGEAAAGRGDDVNHLFAAANSLSQVLDSPLRAITAVKPQLSDMLVNDEAFNNYFAQTPLDQLVANSENTWQAFAANAQHLQSLLAHADSTLAELDTALNGQPANLASIIQTAGGKGGTIDRLNRFTYLLALFGANLTGKEAGLGTDPASQDISGDIVAAITNVASAFRYSDACPAPSRAAPGSVNDNHCSLSPDGRQHYLDSILGHFAPCPGYNNANPVPFPCPLSAPRQTSDPLSGFSSLFAD